MKRLSESLHYDARRESAARPSPPVTGDGGA
jgi:hypothetical protein